MDFYDVYQYFCIRNYKPKPLGNFRYLTDSETESADQSTSLGEEAVKGRFSPHMKGKT